MKYLFLSPMVWGNYRGRNVELPLGLSAKGNECIYINPIKYKNWEKESMRLHTISSHPSHAVQVIERFSQFRKSLFLVLRENYDNVRMVHKYKPEVVVSWDYLMSLFVCIYCKWKHIPFVFDAMDDWGEMEKSKIIRYYYKHIVYPIVSRLSYAITSTSHKQAELFNIHNKNVFVIPNGKPLDFIEKAGQSAILAGLESKTVNFISTLRDWYDFDLLFEVFGKFPQLQLNIYGQGELFNYLENRSSSYPNITMKGNADSEILPALMTESLFGILPLKLNKLNDSTCPVKLFDYWSAKKAVITSPTHELRKMAEDGGIILTATKEDYINAIQSLLADTAYRKSIGEKGYANMITRYNYDIITNQFIEALSSVK